MTKRESLARVLAKYHWSVETPDFDEWFSRPHIRGTYLEQVDALLAELREPDAAMVDKELDRRYPNATGVDVEMARQTIRDDWRAFVDAIK